MSVQKTIINLFEEARPVRGTVVKWGIWEFKVIRVKSNQKGEGANRVECIGVNTESMSKLLYKKGVRASGNEYYIIKDNIVSIVKMQRILDMIVQHGLALDDGIRFVFNDDKTQTDMDMPRCNKESIKEATQDTVKVRFSRNLLLKEFDIEKERWLKDDQENCYLTFKNGIVNIKAGRVSKLIDYADSPGYVWEKQIIQRDYKAVSKRSKIQDFLDMAIGKENKVHYMTAIGFMVHTYCGPEGSPILLCTDATLSPLNEGGNGKDFFGQIIGQVRKLDVIEGKQMTENNRFLFEAVHPDTQIAWFRDIKKSYKFENMYNLTEGSGMQVRQINRDPFRVKAKVGVSLQHLIDMEGRSDQRRQAFLKFRDEIGKRGGVGKALKEKAIFSDDWKGDWNAFYSFIVSCVQLYLKKGLVKQNIDDLIEQRVNEISENYEFDKLELGKFYSFAGLLEALSNDVDPNRQKIFYMKQAVYAWAKNLGYEVSTEQHKNKKGIIVKSRLYVSSRKGKR